MHREVAPALRLQLLVAVVHLLDLCGCALDGIGGHVAGHLVPSYERRLVGERVRRVKIEPLAQGPADRTPAR
eukprot:58402-Prymnesium_polylepis.1